MTASATWTHGDVVALAYQHCTLCYGLGFRPGRNGAQSVCDCVLRSIFRAVLRRWIKCSERAAYVARVSLESASGSTKKGSFGFKNEEFLADFALVARRTLGGRLTRHWRIFEMHYLRGMDWKLCCRRLGLARGEFYHECYRIEAKIGRACKETRPYGLWPLDEYFGAVFRRKPQETHNVLSLAAPEIPQPHVRKAIAFPLAVAA